MAGIYEHALAFLAGSALFLGTNALAGSVDISKETPAPAPKKDWAFELAVPGWLAGFEGDVGIRRFVSNVDLKAHTILRSIDMVVLLRGEIAYKRFGLMGDLVHLSLSDSQGFNTVVNKVDLRVDETLGQLALRYRLWDCPRGYLDVYGGARYVSLYDQVASQPNSRRIDQTTTALVDEAVGLVQAGEDLGTIRDSVGRRLRRELAPLLGRVAPSLPDPPLLAEQTLRIRQRLLRALQPELAALAAALRAKQLASTEAQAVLAQSDIDSAKAQLSKSIARTVYHQTSRSASLTNWWIDPFIGLRGRVNLSRAWYLVARGDVGGFGVGSKLAWEAEGSLGCQVTRSVFVEAGYRALGMDYQNNAFTYDTITHGAQMLFGIQF